MVFSKRQHADGLRPNILFILTDQQRFDSLGCYGSPCAHTPRLDELARQGVRFKTCYANNPICTPSRASLMTGLPLPEHGVYKLFDRLSDQHVLFPAHLREAGYRTGLIGKLHVSDYKHEAMHRHPSDGFDVYEWCQEPSLALDSPQNGYARFIAQHDSAFYERLKREGRGVRRVPKDCHMSSWAADQTIRFMRDTPEDQPFFAMMSLFDPHNPYDDWPAGYDGLVAGDRIAAPVAPRCAMDAMPLAIQREHVGSHLGGYDELDPASITAMRRGYYASIAFLDEQVGRVLDALRDQSRDQNTLVIFTSDHGDMLGDHGLLVKGAFFYDPCTRVPLLMRWPGVLPAGEVSEQMVQLNDLAGTCLGAAGLDEVAARRMPDARNLLDSAANSRSVAICHYLGSGISADGVYFDPPIYGSMIRGKRYKMNVYWHDASLSKVCEGQLFDMQNDPDELDDLWLSPQAKAIRRDLWPELRESLAGVEMADVG